MEFNHTLNISFVIRPIVLSLRKFLSVCELVYYCLKLKNYLTDCDKTCDVDGWSSRKERRVIFNLGFLMGWDLKG